MDIRSIAITGVSGRFPNANSVDELKRALLEGVDLITDDHQRWPYESLETPPSMGLVQDFDRFDAAFFETNPKYADLLDPRGRKLLEVVHESIIDAGVNPIELRGSNTGVFLALMQNSQDHSHSCSGINSSTYMIANSISYNFDFHGPSYGIDTGCASSIYAVQQAVDSLRLGRCDAAVVCSAHASFLPYDSMEFNRLGVLNPDGRCRPFDDDRKGYVKSEAVVSIILQKKQHSRRIYATIAGVGCNIDGYKEYGIVHPSAKMQLSLFRDVYQRFDVDPNSVIYVDCHGTGTLVGDMEECQALADFFARGDRQVPLKIGSVKSNLGHTEAASGLVSLVKLLIAIQAEVIPSNLHMKTVATDIPALSEGRLTVVSQNIPYQGGLLAINSFGLGGVNSHLIINPYPKTSILPAELKAYRLLQVSGRTEYATHILLENIKKHKDNQNFLSLIEGIFSNEVKNHIYRGFVVLSTGIEAISKCSYKKRPIWFSFSGLGSQWPKMGKDLMHFDVFKRSITKCIKAVKPYGVDLEDALLNADKDIYDDPSVCFPSIVAIAIGLTDLLSHFGIKPDYIIGHSLGEIGCAYADGLLTAEQATLAAYARGWATKNTKLIPGLMASVGLSAEECEKLLPDDVFLACDNSSANVTISGPEKSIRQLTDQLHQQGIFVRIVNTANIAFHSRYVENVGPKLMEFLKTLIPEAGLRKRWLPSAVPESQWDSDLGKYNSAEYHHNNFMKRVLYRQVLEKVPKDAVLVEIAPCGLFQAIFRRSLLPSTTWCCLMEKYSEDNQEFLLKTLGNIYLAGGPPISKSPHETPEIPVGPETPCISSLIKWNHNLKWSFPKYNPSKFFGKVVEIDLSSMENKFLLGHVIDGANVYPTAGYIILVWKIFAAMLGKPFEKVPVIIRNLTIHKTTTLDNKDRLILVVNIIRFGVFNITDGEALVASGEVSILGNLKLPCNNISTATNTNSIPNLSATEVYQLLKLRRYDYQTKFRSILEIYVNNKSTKVKWNKNWITFLDSILQGASFFDSSELVVPKTVSKIIINPLVIHQVTGGEVIVKHDDSRRLIYSSLIEVRHITWNSIPYKPIEESLNYKRLFVSNIADIAEHHDSDEVLQIVLQIVIENSFSSESLQIAEVLDEHEIGAYQTRIMKVLHPSNLRNLHYHLVKSSSAPIETNYNLIIDPNLENNMSLMGYLKNVSENTFVYNEMNPRLETVLEGLGFVAVFKRKSVCLFKKVCLDEEIYIIDDFNDDDWVNILQGYTKENNKRVILVHDYADFGITGFWSFIKAPMCTRNIRIFCIEGMVTEKFSLGSKFYREQLRKDLTMNVLKDNEWGTYRNLFIGELHGKNVESCFASLKSDKLYWLERNPYRFTSNEVNVCYSSIDFWDLRHISLENGDRLGLGLEYSGVSKSGARLMGLSHRGSLTTHLEPHQCLTWSVPEEWTLEQAATVPYAYIMSYYGLFSKGHLQTQNTILVTYRSYSTNLAAINFALYIGCTVLIGVNISEYNNEITGCFPTLEHYVVDFSDSNYPDVIMQKSKGQGIDIIFNYGDDDIAQSALEILNEGGKIITLSNTEEHSLSTERSCVEKLTLQTLLEESFNVLEDIRTGIENYISLGVIKPFPSKTIGMAEVNNLLQNFNSADRNGKITVQIEPMKGFLPRKSGSFIAQPRTFFDPQKSYVVISDLEVFDLEVIRWFSKRGATKIVVNSTKVTRSGLQCFWLDNLQREGCKIVVTDIDVTSIESAKALLHTASSIGDIGGIFAFVMDAGLPSAKKQLSIVHHLDIASRSLCNLDYFVVFSSLDSSSDPSCKLFGSYLGASLQSLCETRKQQNLPALTIQWGPIDTVTARSKHPQVFQQSLRCCLSNLDSFLQLDHVSISSAAYSNHVGSANSSRTSLSGSVAKIFGISNAEQIDSATTLVNLGMDSITGFEVKHLLSQFNIRMDSGDIRKLTMDNIKRLEQECTRD